MSAISNLESMSGLVAFVASVETGGFAAAGRRLGVSASAVGKAVARLEARLGVRLLHRTTRSIAVTGEGNLLFERATRIIEDVQEAENAIAETRTFPRGLLKVSIPAAMGRRIIVPALDQFIAAYPNVILDVSLDDRMVDIVEGGFDLVLRTGDLDDSRLIARKLAPHRFVTCGSPAYLERRGAPQTPDDVPDHTCLRLRFPTTGRLEYWAFKGWKAPGRPPNGPVFNDIEAVALAAIAGLGLAQVPHYLAARAIADGRLRTVLADYAVSRGDIWLIRPPASSESPRVRVFATFLTKLIESI
ncbi:LysR family transcriptional regulator [Mesorhizobium kowhaii]|uniref:LysR family transcriptional regulator n=1 Tax=Mesorhizobium kowhaii TaxID=1300272 RepID=A0A2W7DRN0_9HYPH|nr:LysR family transcriptional regulator [Mesorhizobium kowhaii]PZV33966.1 LysR family transcriptional regulator [Mesorhizobium kowhaii]